MRCDLESQVPLLHGFPVEGQATNHLRRPHGIIQPCKRPNAEGIAELVQWFHTDLSHLILRPPGRSPDQSAHAQANGHGAPPEPRPCRLSRRKHSESLLAPKAMDSTALSTWP